jgi:hypothetical protein
MKEQKLPHGQSIVGFSSMEEMVDYMDAKEQEAIENTLPAQWEIKWGARVLRIVEDLVIFGHIFTEQEFLEINTDPEKPDEETIYELDGLKRAHDAGYRYGIWYSVVEPEGEYGSAHVSTLWEITPEDFSAGRENGWEVAAETVWRVAMEMKNEQRAFEQTNHERKEEG